MKKVALFFGAGAECSYGLPSGGKFALDIFRMDTKKDKENLKGQLSKVNTQSTYARWLPSDYQSRKLTAFTKGQYDIIIKGSLENKRGAILDYLSNFDDNVGYLIHLLEREGRQVEGAFENILGEEIGTFNYEKDIKLNSLFAADANKLFSSDYFSAFLRALQVDDASEYFKKNIQNITRAILELLIGSVGEDLMQRLNDKIFDESPETMDLFDDLGAVFTLDYKNTGMRGLELLVENEITNKDDTEGLIIALGLLVLEDIYSRALDYQTLIDTNWRYIYNPKSDWGKFSKISVFLHTVKRYIEGIAEASREKIACGNGYYHDVLELKNFMNVCAVGTTNYNSFIEEIVEEQVTYLNGSVNDYYDPYLNKIVSFDENEQRCHIVVPFLFTQSGTKPLTSIKMSERYVSLFNHFKEADTICVCGFGFNADDGHINGMFRELIDDFDKDIVILHYVEHGKVSNAKLVREYQYKLRIEKREKLKIIQVNRERKDIESNQIWYKTLNL